MDAEKILEAAKMLEKRICEFMESREFKIAPFRQNPDIDPNMISLPNKLNHVLWLVQEVPNFITTGRREKAMRWVCHVQGVLWGLNIIKISEAKDQNRPTQTA